MKRFDTSRPEFSPYGFTCELWKPVCMPRPDRHNEIELNLLSSGSLTYLIGGRRTAITANQLAVFWAAIPHQIVDFEGTAPYFVVTLPLSEFLRADFDRRLIHRVLEGEILLDPHHDPVDQQTFHRWEQELRSDAASLHRAARLEVQARLLRLACRVSRPANGILAVSLSRADQLACYIARNYRKPLTSQMIADANDVHPNYAMNLFRNTFGTTMSSFITHHRVSHAQRLLVTTEDSILDIALDSGFQSLSRFNEAFKMSCGCSPRDYRKRHHPDASGGESG